MIVSATTPIDRYNRYSPIADSNVIRSDQSNIEVERVKISMNDS